MTMSYKTIWGTIISSYFPLFFVPILSLVLNLGCPSDAQHFTPELEDKAYLNNVEKEIVEEVNKTRAVFYQQAVLLDRVAREFVAAQLKENLFIALRVLAEKELAERGRTDDENLEGNEEAQTTLSWLTSTISELTTLKPYNRTKRQDDGDEDGDDGDAAGAAAGAAGVPNRPTIPPQIGLLPQVANLVRVIFGGNGNSGVNLTSYVASASKLLPRPVGNQVLGLVKILTNANANINRNSFTTANPLLAGPASLNFKAPGAGVGGLPPGLTPEQLIALGGLPPESLAGLTPEQLTQLAGLNGLGGLGLPGGLPGGVPGGVPGLGGVGDLGGLPGGIPGIPPGLTANDIAALAALGVTGLPDLSAPQGPRPTRRPKPQYNNKPLNQQQQQLPHQILDPHDANLIQSQQFLNHPQYQLQNPQFIAAADKDILPLNLNPNKQTISEIQQQLIQAQQPVINYQEAPQSPSGPSDLAFVPPKPQPVNTHNSVNALHQASTAGQSGSTQTFIKPSLSSGFGQQLAQNQKLQLQGQNPNGFVDEDFDASIIGSGQQVDSGNKPHRKPLTPLQQEQALLQQQQLQIIRIQEAQKQNEIPQQQLASPGQVQQQQQFNPQSQQQFNPTPQQPFNPQQQQQQFNPQQQQQFNPQQQQTQQFNPQQQQQTQQQPFNPQQQQQLQNPQQLPPPQQQPQQQQQIQTPQLTAQQQFQSLFQPQQQRQRPPQQQQPSGSTDEEESEEDDRARQLNILGNIFPLLLGSSNNNAQQQQQQQPQPQPPQAQPPTVPVSPGNTGGNGTAPAQATNPNMNFDLNMFASNLRRGIGDVVRVMPDLFRGAREGLQLIQALSSILRAFPGLADALPI